MMNKQQLDPLSNKFTRAAISILSFSSRLEYGMSGLLKPLSLTMPQFNALCVLASRHPEPTVLKNLTEQMIDKSSNTSRLVDKLAEKKLVIRQLTPTDKRIIHICLTEEGLNITNGISDTLETHLNERFSPDEQNNTAELVEALKILRGE